MLAFLEHYYDDYDDQSREIHLHNDGSGVAVVELAADGGSSSPVCLCRRPCRGQHNPQSKPAVSVTCEGPGHSAASGAGRVHRWGRPRVYSHEAYGEKRDRDHIVKMTAQQSNRQINTDNKVQRNKW